jgi:hypothetical protein
MQTGILTEAEPKPEECNDCYILTFHSDTKGLAKVVITNWHVNLAIKYIFRDPDINYEDIYYEEGGNTILFHHAIGSVDSYKLENNELKFFYNNQKNYLLYILIES